MNRRLLWLAIFAVAMAYVESAVVVYLRELYYPGGFSFPIVIIPDKLALIEVGREAATIVMLAGLAILAGAGGWQRFLLFCVAFGIWDIFYYIWLRVFLGWPPSLLTWDILFLIPLPWIGPVLAPVIISVLLGGSALWLLRQQDKGAALRFTPGQWALAIAGGIAVLAAFMLDHRVAFEGAEPPPFRWGLFGAGIAAAMTALVMGARRLQEP